MMQVLELPPGQGEAGWAHTGGRVHARVRVGCARSLCSSWHTSSCPGSLCISTRCTRTQRLLEQEGQARVSVGHMSRGARLAVHQRADDACQHLVVCEGMWVIILCIVRGQGWALWHLGMLWWVGLRGRLARA